MRFLDFVFASRYLVLVSQMSNQDRGVLPQYMPSLYLFNKVKAFPRPPRLHNEKTFSLCLIWKEAGSQAEDHN